MDAKTAKETVVYHINQAGKICPVFLYDYVFGLFDFNHYQIIPVREKYMAIYNYRLEKGIFDSYDDADNANFVPAYNNMLESKPSPYNSKKEALEAIAEMNECCIEDAEKIQDEELHYKVSPYDAEDESEDEIFYSLKEAVDYFANPSNKNIQLTRHVCGKQTWWDESHFNKSQLDKLSQFINKKFGKKFTLKTPKE